MSAPQHQQTSPLLQLLRQIDAGVVIYEPFLHTPEHLREFDDTVARLQEMERLGLVKKLFTEAHTSSGKERIDFVMVIGGLTEEGRRLIDQYQISESSFNEHHKPAPQTPKEI